MEEALSGEVAAEKEEGSADVCWGSGSFASRRLVRMKAEVEEEEEEGAAEVEGMGTLRMMKRRSHGHWAARVLASVQMAEQSSQC